jgi:hypothetical protein
MWWEIEVNTEPLTAPVGPMWFRISERFASWEDAELFSVKFSNENWAFRYRHKRIVECATDAASAEPS